MAHRQNAPEKNSYKIIVIFINTRIKRRKFRVFFCGFISDLGIDVPPEKIVETAKENGVKIMALSGVLTLAIDSMQATIEAFKAAGMRDEVKVIIGGNPVTEGVCQRVGADDWATNPQKTLQVCKGWA